MTKLAITMANLGYDMQQMSDEKLAWYRRMVEIRLFEDKVQELFQQGMIEGTTHLCQGQEAVSVGSIAALGPENMAAVWKAPVVFIIENNLYGEYSAVRDTTPIDDLADRAQSYGIPGVVVDGQDVEAVHGAAQAAVVRARSGDGPSLLEMKTYRYRGHSRTDPAKYRAPGELERWKERDPIELLGAALAQAGALEQEARRDMWTEVQALVDAAAARAAEAPYPTLEETRHYVYAN